MLPPWAVRLLIGSLLLAPLLVTVDGFARARRRHHPVTPWLGWIGAAAAPFALAAAFATVLGITGLLTATPPAPVPAGAIPIDGAGRAALVATGLVFVLAVLARPLLLRLMGGRRRLEGPGAGAALLLVWTVLAALLWVVNPYAAAFMVPAAHLWLLVAAPGRPAAARCRAGARALSLLPFASARSSIAGQAGSTRSTFVWALLLAVAGGQIGPVAWLFWSIAAGCASRRSCSPGARAAGRRTSPASRRSPCAARSRTRAPDRSAARSRRCGDEARGCAALLMRPQASSRWPTRRSRSPGRSRSARSPPAAPSRGCAPSCAR